jgi:uncharacterized cupredoxin-like copper-binding protein
MQKKVTIAILIVVVVVVGYFILTGLQRPAPQPETKIPELTKTEVVSPEELNLTEKEILPKETTVREIAVSGTEFSFKPDSITLTKGEKVKIVFTNAGKAPHDLTIEGLGIKTKVIGSGQTDSIEFVTPASGTYTFYCSIPGHREAGMKGSIEIK